MFILRATLISIFLSRFAIYLKKYCSSLIDHKNDSHQSWTLAVVCVPVEPISISTVPGGFHNFTMDVLLLTTKIGDIRNI